MGEKRDRYLWAVMGLVALAGCGNSDMPPTEDLAGTIRYPQGQNVFIACGESIGRALFQEPEEAQNGWEDDRVSKGRYVFSRDAAGKLHILYSTEGQGWVDEEEDGGTVVEVRKADDELEVEAVVYYTGSGVMETYSVHGLPDGTRWLLWTTNKTRVGGLITKVAAYRAKCV